MHQTIVTIPVEKRIAFLDNLASAEGTELGDAIGSILAAANTLQGIGEDHAVQILLLTAEDLAIQYCEWLKYEGDENDFEYITADTFKHFTGSVHPMLEAKMKFKKGANAIQDPAVQ